jgi:hypothetical protein
MLAFLRQRGLLSERKYSLFAYAAVRRAWHLMAHERSRRALEVAEAAADWLVDAAELRPAVVGADKAAYRANRAEDEARLARQSAAVAQRAVERKARRGRAAAEDPALTRAQQVAQQAARRAEELAERAEDTRGAREAARAARLCVRAAEYRSLGGTGAEVSLQQAIEAAVEAVGGSDQEHAYQSQLLRDLFGPLPFQPVGVEPSLLRWNDGTVVRVARGIYDDRAFGRMPILADALVDAGCENDDILLHCREPGAVHAKGCWVLDLLLSRE